MRRAVEWLALVSILAPLLVRADELKLKDGTRISGNIVGFEDNAFRVKTSYGFAVVQKEQVVSISVSDAAKTSSNEKLEAPTAQTGSRSAGPSEPIKPTVTTTQPPIPVPRSAESAALAQSAAPSKPEKISTPATAASATAAHPTSPTTQSILAVAPPPAPPLTPAPPSPARAVTPEPIREKVIGNTYMNETYGFQMYKPPDWQVIAGVPSVLPGAIAAMGTADQTTYLLIGQASAGKTLAADIDLTERRLRDIMDNFRPLGEQRISVSGITAVEHRFRGGVDQHDWSGIVVFVPRGTNLFTIFGMTAADSDLVQIQENVISRAISSLQFQP